MVENVHGATNKKILGSPSPELSEPLQFQVPLGETSQPWNPPQFASQHDSLGYEEGTFSVPSEIVDRVQFWKNIYSKYSTDQGVIHDLHDLRIVYSVVDFNSLQQRQELKAYELEKLKKDLVEKEKDKTMAILSDLAIYVREKQTRALNNEEKRIYDQFFKAQRLEEIQYIVRDQLRWQQGLKDRMQEAIFISGRYLKNMEKVFAEYGLPKELTRLVFVESSFNLKAKSKVGASGLWQIMPSTARPHQMIRTHWDLRNHPESATKLAAQILKDNYKKLESWPLAVTGYNHGPNGVKKLVERYRTRNLGEVIRRAVNHKSFGFASKNFYASFLAALEVESHANQYFPGIRWARPLPQREFHLNKSIRYRTLVSWFDNNEIRLQLFNPHLINRLTKKTDLIPAKALISVPRDRYSRVVRDLQGQRLENSAQKWARTDGDE